MSTPAIIEENIIEGEAVEADVNGEVVEGEIEAVKAEIEVLKGRELANAKKRLTVLDEQVAQGLTSARSSTLAVGVALREIRGTDGVGLVELTGQGTFTEYVKATFGLARDYADKFCSFATTVEALESANAALPKAQQHDLILPVNEGQARELFRVIDKSPENGEQNALLVWTTATDTAAKEKGFSSLPSGRIITETITALLKSGDLPAEVKKQVGGGGQAPVRYFAPDSRDADDAALYQRVASIMEGKILNARRSLNEQEAISLIKSILQDGANLATELGATAPKIKTAVERVENRTKKERDDKKATREAKKAAKQNADAK